jgi:uncharacterized hydrophobic protein (TIGR00271 family)
MTGKFIWLRTSPQRIETVIGDIKLGSEPRFSFYAMLFVASLIASIGLIANSTAVIIGAMLVSPLMTPIFGIALGMLRGDTRLFWKAVSTEVLGVVIAIGIAFILGVLPLAIEATPEMLARTKPNLLDLLVAVFAGVAGTFAIIDERVSPALPGVAIATAIVPPLSNTGLCLALGAYSGAIGSFTLFVANFFAILLIGALTFAAAGMMRRSLKPKQQELARKFLFAVAGFVFVSVLLTHSLIIMVEERRNTRIVSTVITNGLAQLDLPPFTVLKIVHSQVKGNFQVIATVLTSEIVSPEHVSAIQKTLTDTLHRPTELVVRTLPVHDTAAAGSNAMVAKPNLDGRLISSELSHREKQERIAEQFMYEQLTGRLGLKIEAVNYGLVEDIPSILVTLRTSTPFSTQEIRKLRKGLQDRLDLPDLGFSIQSVETSVFTEEGPYLIEWTNYDTIKDLKLVPRLQAIVKGEVARTTKLFTVDVHINEEKGTWRALAEVVGLRAPESSQVAIIQNAVAMRFTHPVEVYLWYKNEFVATASGYSTYNELTEPMREKRIETLSDIFNQQVPKIKPSAR